MSTRITTIVPTFRRPRMLARAVRSALNQTYRELRIEIYDNASGDETAEVAAALAAEDPRVRYHRRDTNIGLVENFAAAQAEVETEFFSFLADDEILLPDFYARALAALEANPDAIFAASPVLYADPSGRILVVLGSQWPVGIHRAPDGMLALLDLGHFAWTAMLFRRAATTSVGMLDPRAGVCADLDFMLRLAGRHEFATMRDPGAIFSWHESSATSLPRLAQFWPTWPWIATRLSADTAIPLAARRAAASRLTTRLPHKVLLAGLLAVSQGRLDEAREAAAVLARRLGRPWEAALVRLVAAACGLLPPLRAVLWRLAGRVRWRKPPKGLQAEFDRGYRRLLALPELPLPTDRKDSAA